MKRFYVGTILSNAGLAVSVGAKLVRKGWTCSYDWTAHGPATTIPGDQAEVFASIARAELRGVTSADAVLLLHPMRYGSHVELGAALVLAEQGLTRIYLWQPPDADVVGPNGYPCVFHHHPAVCRFDNLDTMIETVLRDGEEGK